MDEGITHPPVYILHTTYNQKVAFLVTVTLCPAVLSLSCGVAEGILEAQGHEHAAGVLQTVQLCTWSAIHFANSIIALYYGYKLSIVLRYHIIATETKLGLPVRGFGIANFISELSARYLYAMSQLTAFGASAVFFLAGTQTGVWALRMDELRRAEDERWPHLMAFVWICANAATFLVKLGLVTCYFRRSKKIGVLDISSNTSWDGGVTPSVVVELDNLPDDESTMDLMLYDIATGNGRGSCSCENMSSGKNCGPQWDAKERQETSSPTQPKKGDTIGSNGSTDVMSQKDPQDRLSPPQKAGTCGSSEQLEPRVPHISLERARQVQEFLTLKQGCRTALRFIDRVQTFKQAKQRSSRHLQQFQVFMRQLQALHTQLRQLQQYYFECCDYKAQTNDAAVTADDVRRESDMLVLQQNLKYTLEMIILQMEPYCSQLEISHGSNAR
ncbi:hypothetical protein BGZ68_007860 [Mortierella alpina]|nr:hypothetical protein BGZ68_007860 [Mortierella alpina]